MLVILCCLGKISNPVLNNKYMPCAYLSQQSKTKSGSLGITCRWYEGNSWRWDVGGVNLLVDPVFSTLDFGMVSDNGSCAAIPCALSAATQPTLQGKSLSLLTSVPLRNCTCMHEFVLLQRSMQPTFYQANKKTFKNYEVRQHFRKHACFVLRLSCLQVSCTPVIFA